MRFLLDTNILIPLEDSQIRLDPSLRTFVRLARENAHQLVYHPASIDDIEQDTNAERRQQTLERLDQYVELRDVPACPWPKNGLSRNDQADNEILYALELDAAHVLVTEDRKIHDRARHRGLVDRCYTIQTAEDLLKRLHDRQVVQIPHISDAPLYTLTPYIDDSFFDSLRASYSIFDAWFREKAKEGRMAWVNWEADDVLGGLCIYTEQENERITKTLTLPGRALKLATFKVGATSRGKKIGELFLKAAFRYASENKLEYIFIHGNKDRQHFLFEMLATFGFEQQGSHLGDEEEDIVFVKHHPSQRPRSDLLPFDFFRKYYPHFRRDVQKYVVPIRPDYHKFLFPDYAPKEHQIELFHQQSSAGNAIKMAYLCHAQT